MQSPVKDVRLPDVHLPDIDVSKLTIPEFELPKVDLDMLMDRATAATGVGRRERSRWPYVIVGGIAIVAAGWMAMNWSSIVSWVGRAKEQVMERVGSSNRFETYDEPVAFPAAETAPLEQPPVADSLYQGGADYPEGLGAQSEPETVGANGRAR